jgi:hypothetical protein
MQDTLRGAPPVPRRRLAERDGGLTSPVRNHYFYGKLLDAEHLELEQDYFVQARRLNNRLTLGSGVLCGLEVKTTADGGVRISPGVAVDGLGREIVVTDPILVEDPWALTDACAEPTGKRLEHGPVLLCLAYHECAVDPAPVLVADCELREECVPGAIRERYRLLVRDPKEGPDPPGDPCDTFRTKTVADSKTPYDVALEKKLLEANMRAELNYGSLPQGASEKLEYGSSQPRPERTEDLRRELCEGYRPSCAPGPECVPLALVAERAEHLFVDACGPRTTIYSNAVLLDLILCLSKRVEACCGRKLTTEAPKVTAVVPGPADSIKLSDLDAALNVSGGGLSITFDQEMRDESLAEPAEWLRVVVFSQKGGMRAAELNFERLDGKTTAVYSFAPVKLGKPHENTANEVSLAEALRAEGGKATFLVQIRSDDITQIASKGDSPTLLDADYRGTSLTGSELDLFWLAAGLLAAIPFPSGGSNALEQQVRLASPPSLPSGNLIEGGRLHSWFELTL